MFLGDGRWLSDGSEAGWQPLRLTFQNLVVMIKRKRNKPLCSVAVTLAALHLFFVQEGEYLAKQKQRIYSMALLLAAVIWGSTFFIIKDATTSLSTAHILALRFAVGAVCLGFLCGRRLRLINRSYIKWGMALGTLTFAAYGVHIYGLELDTTPGKSAFLTSIYCVVVPFVYWLLGRSRPDRFEFGAAALCLLGIGLISLNEGLVILRGDLYTLLSGLLTGFEIVLIAKACQHRDPIVMTFLQLSVVAGLGIMLVFFQAGLPQQYVLADIAGVVYIGVFATAGCLGLQSIGLKYIDPSAGAIILSLESVFGVIFSICFYGETVTMPMLIGFSFVFAAVIISQTKLRFPFKREKQ